jgi:uncharacterized membrane protein YgaE (UPF0421/DUF939 family)
MIRASACCYTQVQLILDAASLHCLALMHICVVLIGVAFALFVSIMLCAVTYRLDQIAAIYQKHTEKIAERINQVHNAACTLQCID